MADENSNTPNPRRKRPAPTIDLSATEVNAEPPPRASEDNKDTPHTDDTPRSRRPILLAVIAGGLGGAAAVVFGLWFAGLLAPHNSASDLSSRLAKLETQVSAAPKARPPVKATTPRRPVVRRARRVAPKLTPAASHSTTVVMCRPVRPMPELAKGTPTEQSVIPVPQLATNTPPPATPVVEEDGPPIFVSTAPGMPMAAAGGGRSWTPFAIVPAIFIPFVHNGKTHNGATTPIDTTTTPPVGPVTPPDTTKTPPDTTKTPGTPPDTTPVTPPPGDTVPVIPPIDTVPGPPIVPPTTVPEPSTLVLLGSGLLGLVGVAQRRRRK